ncbi:MAG: type IV pilus assembly protein PilM, partial [Actinomycetota bacterium]
MAKARVGIGIDIGTSAVRAAQVSLAKTPSSIERFAQIPLPPGAVVDGEIADPAVVTHTLTEVWKAGGFHVKEANLTISNQKVVARAVEVPYMDAKELRGAIGFQIQEQVPIPIEDAVVDYQVIEEFEGDEGERMLRVLVVAAVRDMVKAFVDAVEAAHIHVNSVDFTALGLIRSLGDAGIGTTGTEGEAIIDIGASVTTIVVHEGGVTRLARVLGAGGHDLTMALSDSLGISAMEAEKLKMRVGVSLSDEESPVVDAEEEPLVEVEMQAEEQAPVVLASTGTEGTAPASAGSDPAAWK